MVSDRTREVGAIVHGLLCAMTTDQHEFEQIMAISRAGRDTPDAGARPGVDPDIPLDMDGGVARAATFSQSDEAFAQMALPDDLLLADGLNGNGKSGWQEGSAS